MKIINSIQWWITLLMCKGLIWLLLVSPVSIASVNVSISPSGGFNIVPGTALVDQSVATITVDADETYNVTIKDDTNGLLVNGSNNMPYTVRYNNSSDMTLSTAATSVESGSSVTSGSRSLTVSISDGASLGIPAGTYNSVITVEILAQ